METLLRIVADKFRTVEANEAFLAATCQMKIEDVKSIASCSMDIVHCPAMDILYSDTQIEDRLVVVNAAKLQKEIQMK